MMLWCIVLVLFMIANGDSEATDGVKECPNVKTGLTSVRKKRQLTFPDGSNFVLTISLVKAFMVHAPAGWNIALEIDVMFPMPNANFTNAHFRKKLHHRQKREFWERLKGALEFHNINGHSCILRSICEAKTYLAPPGRSLVHDILRAVFTAPEYEEDFAEEVRTSYSEVLDPHFCEKIEDCPFSLLNFIMAFNKRT